MIQLIVKSLLFTLLIPGMVAGLIPFIITKGISVDIGGLFISGILFMLVGVVIYCWCVWDFAVFGLGTPAPIDSPKKLVTRGLYDYTRNPMYVAVICFIFGWVLIYTNGTILVYGLCVALCFQLLVVFYEEPILLQMFGDEYLAYKQSVNRWVVF